MKHVVLLAAIVATYLLSASAAFACEAGYCVVETVPADTATDVPTDARIVVYFNTTPGLGEPEGSMVLVESQTGQGLLASVTVVNGANPQAEVSNKVAILEPLLPLAPLTEYELVFGTPSVCAEKTLKFTTGTDPAEDPIFAGATGLTASCVMAPEQLTSCDDQDIFPRIALTATGPAAENAAGFGVYRDGQLVSMVSDLEQSAVQLIPADVEAEECVEVRAIGLAGQEVGVGEVCAMTGGVCPVEPPGEDMGTGPADMGADMGLGADVGTPTDDMGVGEAGMGGAADDMGSVGDVGDGSGEELVTDEGCSCSASGSGRADLGLWFLVGFFGFRRSKRRPWRR